MEETKKAETSTRKSILSIILLLGALVLLMYAAPRLNEKLKEWGGNKTEEVDQSAEQRDQAQVSAELAEWLPLVREQLPKLADKTSQYKLLHMRVNEDKSQLLLDLKEGEEGQRFDLILKRDQFGRYISDNPDVPIRLYPPEGKE